MIVSTVSRLTIPRSTLFQASARGLSGFLATDPVSRIGMRNFWPAFLVLLGLLWRYPGQAGRGEYLPTRKYYISSGGRPAGEGGKLVSKLVLVGSLYQVCWPRTIGRQTLEYFGTDEKALPGFGAWPILLL